MPLPNNFAGCGEVSDNHEPFDDEEYDDDCDDFDDECDE